MHAVPAETTLAQNESVVSDFGVDAVNIGMIGAPETAVGVAERLTPLTGVPIVFDPLMVTTSGSSLADRETVAAFERFFPIATGLAQGLELEAALASARTFVRLALRDAPDLVPSNGPLDHPAVRNDGVPGPAINQVALPLGDYAAQMAFYRRLGVPQAGDSRYGAVRAALAPPPALHAPGYRPWSP